MLFEPRIGKEKENSFSLINKSCTINKRDYLREKKCHTSTFFISWNYICESQKGHTLKCKTLLGVAIVIFFWALLSLIEDLGVTLSA